MSQHSDDVPKKRFVLDLSSRFHSIGEKRQKNPYKVKKWSYLDLENECVAKIQI